MTWVSVSYTHLVTLVAAAHLDALGDLDGVAAEKGALVAALGPTGLAVLSGDDPRVVAMAARTEAPAVLCRVGEPVSYTHLFLDRRAGGPGERVGLASWLRSPRC